MNNLFINSKGEARELMSLAINTGQILIQNGAEIYRAEDTIQRICESRNNISEVNVFAVSTAIFISLEFNNEIITMFKNVDVSAVNLEKIDIINSFSRKFVEDGMTLSEAKTELLKLKGILPYTLMVKSFSAGIASSFFCLLFKGSLKDFFCTFLIAMTVFFLINYISRYKVTFFIENFFGAFLASAMSLTLVFYNYGDSIDKMIIGSIMILVPGVAITNAVRDIMSGDFLSGLIGLTRAIFAALAIALGVGVVLNYKYTRGL